MGKRHLFAGLLRSNRQYIDISSNKKYTKIPLYRGFTEIRNIFSVIEKHNAFICGGYARRCASPAEDVAIAEDLDIYTFNVGDWTNLYEEMQRLNWFQLSKQTPFSITMISKNHEANGDIKTIQLINPEILMNEPKRVVDILENFDFNVCKCAIISPTEAIAHTQFHDDEKYKTLLVDGEIKNPVMLFYRIMKYNKKGYKVSARLVIELMQAIKAVEYKDGSIAKAVSNSMDYLNGKESGLMREFMFGNVTVPKTESPVETKKDPFDDQPF